MIYYVSFSDDFLNNAVSNIEKEALKVSQNQTVSTIIENLIAVASPSNLRMLFVAMVEDLNVSFMDRFASHVFESLVQRMACYFHCPPPGDDHDEEDDVTQEVFLEKFDTMCSYLDTNFDSMSTHAYGSHVLRALLEAFSSVPVANELKKGQKSGYHNHFKGKGKVTL